jgi:predicted RNA-binding Zn-ribbon protein involved in translation (DUF1610 family)
MAIRERVWFRLIICPSCSHQFCWVNPRLPNYCPECGEHLIMKLREHREAIRISDDKAILILTESVR